MAYVVNKNVSGIPNPASAVISFRELGSDSIDRNSLQLGPFSLNDLDRDGLASPGQIKGSGNYEDLLGLLQSAWPRSRQ